MSTMNIAMRICDAVKANRAAIIQGLTALGISGEKLRAVMAFLANLDCSLGQVDATMIGRMGECVTGCDMSSASESACTSCKNAGAGVYAVLNAVIQGGQSGLNNSTAGGPPDIPLDWNCRRSSGDMNPCETKVVTGDEYPTFEGLVPYQVVDPQYLPPINTGAGFVWWAVEIPLLKLSQLVCLDGFQVLDAGGNQINPTRIGLQAERIAMDGEDTVVHVWDDPKMARRNGWEITPERCRCVPPPCVCVPESGRVRLIFSTDATPAEATLDVFRPATGIGMVCGPCPPGKICRREVITSTSCGPCTDLDPPAVVGAPQ